MHDCSSRWAGRSPTTTCSTARSTHRSWCAEHGVRGVERAARVPRRLRARPRRHRTTSSSSYPELPEGELAKVRASVVNAERAGRARATSSTSARRCCSARARTRRAGARSRRSSPTRWRRSSPRCTSTAGSSAAARLVLRPARRPHPRAGDRARAGTTTRPGCRSSPPSGSIRLPALRRARRGPRPREALLRRRCYSASEVVRRRARDDRRRQAEQAAARVAWERLQGEASSAAPDRGDRIGVGDA